MHNLLLEILADEVDKENKPAHTFKFGSFTRVAQAINEKFDVECQPNHVENRLRTVKTNWNIITGLRKKSGFGWMDDKITYDRIVYEEEVAV